jgi:hypothetical protein
VDHRLCDTHDAHARTESTLTCLLLYDGEPPVEISVVRSSKLGRGHRLSCNPAFGMIAATIRSALRACTGGLLYAGRSRLFALWAAVLLVAAHFARAIGMGTFLLFGRVHEFLRPGFELPYAVCHAELMRDKQGEWGLDAAI